MPPSSCIGLPEDAFSRIGRRHIPKLRQPAQDPMFFMNKRHADALGIAEGDWTRLKTNAGAMLSWVYLRSCRPKELLRILHDWWKPESRQGRDDLSGLWSFGDTQLTSDDVPALPDVEQGVPYLKGTPCSVVKLAIEEVRTPEAQCSATYALARGSEGRVLRSDPRPNVFMRDSDFGDGIEFKAVELSTYRRYTM